MPDATTLDLSEDMLLSGRIRILQPKRGNRASIDAVLVAAAVPARRGERISDFGAGSGAVGLCVAARVPGVELLAIDRDADMVRLAARNFELNAMGCSAIAVDLCAPGSQRAAAGLEPDVADHVVANPPYLDPKTMRIPPEPGRASAFAADPGVLEGWMKAAAGHACQGGTITVIHRADALKAVLLALEGRAGGIAVKPIQARPTGAATRIIVQGIKGSKAPLSLLPPLTLHNAEGSDYTPEATAILAEASALPLRP